MKQQQVFLKLEPFLAQWFIHDQGGDNPVELTRGSMESMMLEIYLVPRPDGVREQLEPWSGEVAIRVPSFKNKNTKVFNYLTERGRIALKGCIRKRFVIELWQDLFRFENLELRLDEQIFAWMEAHGIDCNDTNYNSIAKIYLRQRKTYRQNKKRQKSKNN